MKQEELEAFVEIMQEEILPGDFFDSPGYKKRCELYRELCRLARLGAACARMRCVDCKQAAEIQTNDKTDSPSE